MYDLCMVKKCPICKTMVKGVKRTGHTTQFYELAKMGISMKDGFGEEKSITYICPKCYHNLDLE